MSLGDFIKKDILNGNSCRALSKTENDLTIAKMASGQW